MGRNISPLEPFLTYRYALQILCLEDEIYETMDLMPTHILSDARKLKKEQQDFYLELQPEDVRSLLIIDAFPSTKLLQQMRLDGLGETSKMEEGFTCSGYDFAMRFQFYPGLAKSIGDLKRPLFQNEVLVLGVRCMAGYFQTLVFIAISQSANVKEFLETLWDNIIERKRSVFQNLEDARIQFQQQLLRQSKSTLLMLDDVGFRANLEKLPFQVAGYKTLFTTRESSIILRNPSTQFYQLPLLCQEDALSLFCLYGKPYEAWESVKNKVSRGELVSDYHIDGVVRFLEICIRFLDDVARGCFSDLRAFSRDKKICTTADALVHIWVSVRKLEWLEAFTILFELASRNLLNLTSNPRSTSAISHGNVSKLYFSQHDIIQDMALHLGGQGIAFQRNGLLVPRKENILPWKWELQKTRPFDAQIVSVHTGPTDKSN